MFTTEIKQFYELTLDEFHDMVALRLSVFVLEQNCTYQDLDGKDKLSYHLLVKDKAMAIVGTARIIPAGIVYPEIAIGRVVSDQKNRNSKIGHLIMGQSLTFIQNKWSNKSIKLSAQSHLRKFYEKHEFVATGKEYLEDGIPHMEMHLTKQK